MALSRACCGLVLDRSCKKPQRRAGCPPRSDQHWLHAHASACALGISGAFSKPDDRTG